MRTEFPFIARFEETVEEFGMFREGEQVGVAVSGGVDSVVLLHLLWERQSRWRISLHVLHLNHGIRGKEAERDERFVRGLAEELSLPFFGGKVDVPSYRRERRISLEEAARELRYRFFQQAREALGLGKVALGHTADDQVETVLMGLLRRGGSKALKGIPLVREFYVRPLLKVWREEVEEYARKQGLPFVEDSTNLKVAFLRNRIRHELIPYLESYNPRIKERLLALSEILRDEDEFLEGTVEEAEREVKEREGVKVFPLPFLRSLHPAIRGRLLQRVFLRLHPSPLSFEHLRRLQEVIGGKRRACGLPGGLRAWREGEELWIGRERATAPLKERPLRVPGTTPLEEIGSVIEAEVLEGPLPVEGLTPDVALLDYEKLQLPLRVRGPKEGDRFVPSGMRGEKKLQDFFVDLKVPRCRRSQVPLVLSGEEICWVGGLRVNERFKAHGETRRVLRLRLRPYLID